MCERVRLVQRRSPSKRPDQIPAERSCGRSADRPGAPFVPRTGPRKPSRVTPAPRLCAKATSPVVSPEAESTWVCGRASRVSPSAFWGAVRARQQAHLPRLERRLQRRPPQHRLPPHLLPRPSRPHQNRSSPRPPQPRPLRRPKPRFPKRRLPRHQLLKRRPSPAHPLPSPSRPQAPMTLPPPRQRPRPEPSPERRSCPKTARHAAPRASETGFARTATLAAGNAALPGERAPSETALTRKHWYRGFGTRTLRLRLAQRTRQTRRPQERSARRTGACPPPIRRAT